MLVDDKLVDHDDILVHNKGGGMAALGSQPMDYISRGSEPDFDALCPWDFVATVKKKTLKAIGWRLPHKEIFSWINSPVLSRK
jgi:hypothetical protein